MWSRQRPAYRSSFHIPPLFQHGTHPQPGIPIQDPLFHHFWEQTSVFCRHGKGATIRLHRFREGTQRSKFSIFNQDSLFSSLPCSTFQWCWDWWGVDFQLQPPQRFQPARSPQLLSSFRTSVADFTPSNLSILLGFWLFKNPFMVTLVGFSRKAKLIVCVQFTIFT